MMSTAADMMSTCQPVAHGGSAHWAESALAAFFTPLGVRPYIMYGMRGMHT
jgi:hypothetical protein